MHINSVNSALILTKYLEKSLNAVDQEIIDRLDKSIPLIKDIGKHLIKASGKRLRPLLTLSMAAQLNDFSRKPIILATGASNLSEVKKAISEIKKINKKIILMQCNTNYSNEEINFNSINLNVLKNYKKIFKNIVLGLSDHTPGHATVLGAVTLGARVIEKHFTDDNERYGPDHKFSLNPKTWKLMVDETRRLEKSLGNGIKKIEKNEKLTAFIQRRSYYANSEIKKGEKITYEKIIPLRPFLKNSISPDKDNRIIGKKALRKIKKGECIKKNLIH